MNILREELLRRAEDDQAVRRRLPPGGICPPELAAEWRRIDSENTAFLKQAVAQSGWPGIAAVGPDGATAAWLLLQHADADHDFQKACLPLLEQAVADGDAEPWGLAMLTDRLRVADGLPQVYGSQYRWTDGVFGPYPIEDPDHLDARRAAVGLESAAENDRRLREAHDPSSPASPA
jgi:hypothetical protein